VYLKLFMWMMYVPASLDAIEPAPDVHLPYETYYGKDCSSNEGRPYNMIAVPCEWEDSDVQ